MASPVCTSRGFDFGWEEPGNEAVWCCIIWNVIASTAAEHTSLGGTPCGTCPHCSTFETLKLTPLLTPWKKNGLGSNWTSAGVMGSELASSWALEGMNHSSFHSSSIPFSTFFYLSSNKSQSLSLVQNSTVLTILFDSESICNKVFVGLELWFK